MKGMFNDLRIYLEASTLSGSTLLVTNDRRFFRLLGQSPSFYKKVILPVIKQEMKVIPARLILARDVIDGMP